jgi:SAM-dependent methyltransferase
MKKVNQKKTDNSVLDAFKLECARLDSPRVLELGSKRSVLNFSTLHKDFVPHAGEFLGIDLQMGLDVDILGDVHRLSSIVGRESFDVIISCSTFEHLKYPHLAAHEVMKTLTIGGLLFIQTHHSFIRMDSPVDYFRYTREGLCGLFGTRNGFSVKAVDFEFPARLITERVPDLKNTDVYLNTILYGQKTGKTPAKYIYEFDYHLYQGR